MRWPVGKREGDLTWQSTRTSYRLAFASLLSAGHFYVRPHMVLLAISKTGLDDALRLAADGTAAVWCGSDAISEADYAARRGATLSRFIYPLQGADADTLAGALDTIEEHHPGETVWVEGRREV
jgi:hypothetical protein